MILFYLIDMKPKYKASTDDVGQATRPSYVVEPWNTPQPTQRRRKIRSTLRIGCLGVLLVFACLAFTSLVYLLVPFPTNFLVLGIDRTPEGSSLGRSDTNILVTVRPIRPYIGMLSIPRDLWVTIPGVGENRINTAHFFAEGQVPGSGPDAAMETVELNFGVPVDYFIRLKFDGIVGIVDALGGLDIELAQPMAGFPAGDHHLSGEQSLAFVRDRQDSDDFFRMQHGQLFIAELLEQVLQPASWLRLPVFFSEVNDSVDTNLPIWAWPRLAFALLRAGPKRIDYHVIDRDYVTPTITSEGAAVLIPNWSLIHPLVAEIFLD